MSKLVGNFVISDLVLEQKKRQYHSASRKQFIPGQSVQLYCQIIQKPPFIPTLQDHYLKLSTIQNRNVIQYVEFKETERNYYIFFEQFNSTTLWDIVENQYINEDQAKHYLRQILNGLKGLHEHGITFVDLSLRSIFKLNDEIKIGQINICIDQVSFMNTNQDFEQFDLTKEIIAPEILQGKSKGSIVSDLFSTSVIYYKLLFKRFPFNGNNKQELIESMQKNNIDFTSTDLDISPESVDFLQKTLKFEPSERLKWSDVYSHSLLKLLNVSNTHMAQSALLSISMNKMISPSDLNVKPFDIQYNKQIYKEIEENNSNSKNYQKMMPDQSQILVNNNQNQIGEEGMKEFENMLEITKEVFKNQRKELFRKQIEYYLQQRNMYASLSETLSYARLLDSEYDSANFQFMILKTIYLISCSLQKQMKELKTITDQNNKNKEELLDEASIEQLERLKYKVEEENKIIVQQWTQIFKMTEERRDRAKRKGLAFDEKFITIINELPELALFEQMRDQIKILIEKSSTFKITKNTKEFQKQINLQAVFSLVLVVSYLLKWNPSQILKKSPLEYQDFMRKQSAEVLQNECQEKLQQLDNAFETIKKAK